MYLASFSLSSDLCIVYNCTNCTSALYLRYWGEGAEVFVLLFKWRRGSTVHFYIIGEGLLFLKVKHTTQLPSSFSVVFKMFTCLRSCMVYRGVEWMRCWLRTKWKEKMDGSWKWERTWITGHLIPFMAPGEAHQQATMPVSHCTELYQGQPHVVLVLYWFRPLRIFLVPLSSNATAWYFSW